MSTSLQAGRLTLFSLLLAAAAANAGEPYLVKDINLDAGPQLGSNAGLATAGDEHAFLFAEDSEHGREPWVTDGTAEGTRLLRDVCPGECSSRPTWQWTLGDHLLFSALSSPDGFHCLWVSDGSWEGTRPLDTGVLSEQAAIGELEDRGLFFFSSRPDEEERPGLWVTDGTRRGTRPVGIGGVDGWPLDPVGLSVGRGALVFAASSLDAPFGAWVSDGTDAGTRRLGEPIPGVGSTPPKELRRLPGGTTFFTRHRDSAGVCDTRLWFSDGTSPGTVVLKIFDDPQCSGVFIGPAREAGGAIYFIARDGEETRQLWRSDGTAAGTRSS